MSSVYVLEPPTKGKVLLKTTVGPLDFELWPKEAPKAVRNFVQLCLDGYYDDTIFHRVIKSFMIQGGDRTGSGTGGDTIYGEPFQDEFHSRLKFNHRGLVGCANNGSPHTNNSQFFMTLDRCDWLDKKNTIFGKVTGDTLYNMLKLGEVDTDANDRPLDPPKIYSVEVLWNPFDDVFPRAIATQQEKPVEDVVSKKKKKAKKELNLLSFGEEAEEEEQQFVGVQEMKIKSSHDVLDDPRLLKSANMDSQMDAREGKRRKDAQVAVRQTLAGSSKLHDTPKEIASRGSSPGSDDEVDFDRKMREQILEKRRFHADTTKPDKKDGMQGELSKPTNDKRLPSSDSIRSKIIDDEDAATKKEKLRIRKGGLGSEARAEISATADSDLQLLSPLEQQRLRYKQRRRNIQGREENTLGRLKMFSSKLSKPNPLMSSSAEATNAGISSTDGATAIEKDNMDADWLSHRLKFEIDPTKQGDMSKNDDPDQYTVHDPLLEKGKEKFNKMQAKMKRRNRDWAGNSLT